MQRTCVAVVRISPMMITALFCLMLEAPQAQTPLRVDGSGGSIHLAASPWPKMLGTLRNSGQALSGRRSTPKPWLYETIGAVRSVGGPPSIGADGTVYIGADALYAFDGATGKKRWRVQYGGGGFGRSAVVGFDNVLYVNPGDGPFCALSAITGAPIWSFKAKPSTGRNASGGGFGSSGALGNNGVIYAISGNGSLYALDAKTGLERWHYSTGEQIYSSPTISNDGVVYFTGFAGLCAVDAANGKLLWSVPQCWINGPVALGTDGTIYTSVLKIDDMAVEAVDPKTHEVRWRFPLGKYDASSPAVGGNGLVYSGCSDGNVYAINCETGKRKWQFHTGGRTYLAPAVDSDETVYIGSGDGNMYAINGNTGTKKWSTTIGAPIGTPVAIGSNGLIYFGANNGTIYALRAADGARAKPLTD